MPSGRATSSMSPFSNRERARSIRRGLLRSLAPKVALGPVTTDELDLAADAESLSEGIERIRRHRRPTSPPWPPARPERRPMPRSVRLLIWARRLPYWIPAGFESISPFI